VELTTALHRAEAAQFATDKTLYGKMFAGKKKFTAAGHEGESGAGGERDGVCKAGWERERTNAEMSQREVQLKVVEKQGRGDGGELVCQFTCFTGTKVQILTPEVAGVWREGGKGRKEWWRRRGGAQFSSFTSTKVQILTLWRWRDGGKGRAE
jgi:hypothetical protein